MHKNSESQNATLHSLCNTMARANSTREEVTKAESEAVETGALIGPTPRLWAMLQDSEGEAKAPTTWGEPRLLQVASITIGKETVTLGFTNGERIEVSNFPYAFDSRPESKTRTCLCACSESLSGALGWGDPVFAWLVGFRLDK